MSHILAMIRNNICDMWKREPSGMERGKKKHCSFISSGKSIPIQKKKKKTQNAMKMYLRT